MTSKGTRCNNLFPYTTFNFTIMAITNKELLLNMVKRINEKLSSNIELVQKDGKFTLAETPFPITFAARTSAQMIEYLAGLEDAIDYYATRKEV